MGEGVEMEKSDSVTQAAGGEDAICGHSSRVGCARQSSSELRVIKGSWESQFREI